MFQPLEMPFEWVSRGRLERLGYLKAVARFPVGLDRFSVELWERRDGDRAFATMNWPPASLRSVLRGDFWRMLCSLCLSQPCGTSGCRMGALVLVPAGGEESWL